MGKGGASYNEVRTQREFLPRLLLRFALMQYHILKSINGLLLLSFEHLACGMLSRLRTHLLGRCVMKILLGYLSVDFHFSLW